LPENKKCQFKTGYLPTYECPEPPLGDSEKGYCIFHEPSKDKDIKKFQEGIKEKIGRKDYDFTGYWFPEHTTTFLFSHHNFKKDASFQEATFKGEVDFVATTFEGKAFFRGCTFEGNVFFTAATFEKEADFRGKAKFEGIADFTEATFRRDTALFTGAIFEGQAQLLKTTFDNGADFRQATFKSCAYFEELKIKGLLYLDNETKFEEPKGADVPFRIGKMLWQRQGEYTLAGEYYYKEKIARRKQLPRYSPERWFEYVLFDATCGYGERPWKVLRTGLGVVFGLAFLYRIVGHIYPSPELFNEPHTLTFLDALYFSVVTFTTLGFGDWRPDPSHWIRYVVMSEAFIGAFLMALFIVTFARRMMR